MNKRKWISTALALSLTLGGSLLSFESAVNAEQASVQAQTVFQYTTDISLQGTQLANFELIKKEFEAEKVDLAKVKADYEKNFKDSVIAVNPVIDQELSIVLNAGVEGQATAGQVKQAIDKGLQWFFYDQINKFNGGARTALAAGDKQKAKEALNQAIRLFEGTIYVTAGKRDQDFNTTMQDFLKTTVVPAMQQAVDNGDNTAFNVYRQYFHKTMMKVFVLATSKYAAKIEQDVKEGKNEDAKVHMSEGYFFFMPIYNYLAGGNQEAADSIKNALGGGDASQVKGDVVKSHLATAASAKVNEYAGKALFVDLAKKDKAGALVHAAEGNAFASQLETILDAEVYAQVQLHGQAYYEALEADKVEEAAKEAFEVLKLHSGLKGIYFKIGENELKLNGKSVQFSEKASYLNEQTNRTLASTRFISEALGAKVDWVQADSKVVITKGSTKVELVVGSKDVYVNGKKDDKLQLDQPVVLEDGRTYIPVRAVSNLLKSNVFYYNGEVIIN
ncbi:stalk domain-containing protein [Ammoniphilus sp. 3BR4]|uniref:stalk domain-containing protein n=1 Tax=Ammoniphilus sp. 3BR4 TaxID=3158265 RepID=UPI0034665BEC